MRLLSDSIGRKAIVAVTGLFMVLFVVVHLLGNTTIFAGPDGINAYAEKLHGLGLSSGRSGSSWGRCSSST